MSSQSISNQYATANAKQGFNGRYTAVSVVVTLSIALGLYNCLELLLLISTTFKRWHGLYFWSLLLCTIGTIMFNLGVMMHYFALTRTVGSMIIEDVGWFVMLVTQSLVLYSRLGLITDDKKLIRGVLYTIAFTASTILTTTLILEWGSVYTNNEGFAEGYYYIEYIQIVVITVQEVGISAIYIWKTVEFLKVISKPGTRSLIYQLMAINIFIVAMDIVVIALQFSHKQLYQECLKGFFYSMKLKLELNILSKLVDLVHGPSNNDRSSTLNVIDSNALIGQERQAVKREWSQGELSDFKTAPAEYVNPLTTDEKQPMKTIDGVSTSQPPTDSSSGSGHKADDDNDITRLTSHQSKATARTQGRESDMMYADFLRDMN